MRESNNLSNPRGGSFLNNTTNRFETFNASKSIGATKRIRTKSTNYEDNKEKTSLPSFQSNSSASLHGYGKQPDHETQYRQRHTMNKISIQSKIIYSVVLSSVFVLFVTYDMSSANEFKNELDVDQFKASSEIAKNNVMKEFTLNKIQSHNRVETHPMQIASRENNMIRGYNVRNKLSEMEEGAGSPLDKVTNQLRDALNQNDQKNVRLTITVEDKDKRENRPSGLKVSPGIPLPGQNLQLTGRRGRQIYKPTKKQLSKIKTYAHQISGLNCFLYNGPEHNVAQEVVYWEDIPVDSSYEGPFFHVNENINNDDESNDERDSLNKYLTFQPDTGGFNNNRMAFETALVLSVAMGRTLVLPPRQRFPLMSAGTQKEQLMSFEDIFHLDSLTKEFESVNIITMKEFLIREGLQPPRNRTNWDGADNLNALWYYLEKNSYTPNSWNRNECVVAFPSIPDKYGNDELTSMLENILSRSDGRQFPHHLDFQGKPVPVNAPSIERLREMMSGRAKLCLYTEEMQSSTIIHLPTKPPNQRLLTHFYSFVYFEDWAQSNWIKRLVRDHLRYNDEIMCAAARIIEVIRQSCYSRTNPNGMYHSMHVRRKNFRIQDLEYNITSTEILLSISELDEGSCLFVALDEYDENFVKPIKEKHNLFHLHDFKDLLNGVNPNFYGMIEQVIVSRGQQFYGSFYSTFSGYVNRLRGYFSVLDTAPGSNDGVLLNSFYMPSKYRNENKIYKAIQKPFFAREFPTAWRDIGIR